MNAADVIDRLAGLPPGSPLAELRRQRPDVVRHIQGSDEALFAPSDDGGLSCGERVAAALQVARLLGDARLEDHYRTRLRQLDTDGTLAERLGREMPEGDRRWSTVLAHVARATCDPASASAADIQGLLAVGLSPHAVVSLAQLIAFVNFQSRVLAGLRMLNGAS